MIRILSFCFLVLATLGAQAQGGMLGMDPTATQPLDTVIINTTENVSGAAINTDSLGTFAGQLTMHLGVYSQGQLIVIDTLMQQQVSMLPGETSPAQFSVLFGNAFFFNLGLNDMAMWPASDSVPVTDSVFFQVLLVPDPVQLLQVAPVSNVPPQVQINEQLSFEVSLTNNSIVPLASEMDVYLAVANGSSFSVIDTNHYPQLTLPSLASQTSAFTSVDITTQNGFADGGNIVLIWPEAPDGAGGFTDSLSFPLEVIDTVMSVGPVWPGYYNVKLFPNPSSGPINVQTGTGQPAEAIMVSDLTGQTVQRLTNTNQVLLDELPAGVYIITVVVDANRVRPFRVVHH